jgi:predicted N-acyltransferase
MIDPLGGSCRFNALTQYGYLDTSIATAIVDLEQDKAMLWSELRKSYKALINRALQNYQIVFVDVRNPDEQMFAAYVQLHCKAAGRTTRPPETFEIQMDKIRRDESSLIGVLDEDRFVAFSFFSHMNGGVYYGSMADDPDYDSEKPFEHCMLWKGIEYYKERGFKRLETGAQQFGLQVFDWPDQKNLNISFFKRGFGGAIVPVYRGIKFFRKDDLEKHVKGFLERYERSRMESNL